VQIDRICETVSVATFDGFERRLPARRDLARDRFGPLENGDRDAGANHSRDQRVHHCLPRRFLCEEIRPCRLPSSLEPAKQISLPRHCQVVGVCGGEDLSAARAGQHERRLLPLCTGVESDLRQPGAAGLLQGCVRLQHTSSGSLQIGVVGECELDELGRCRVAKAPPPG